MGEQRTHERVPVVLAGEILIGNRVVLPCRVRDVSRGGALIGFKLAGKLPERFALRIGTSSTTREVAIAWRRDDEVGVRFVE